MERLWCRQLHCVVLSPQAACPTERGDTCGALSVIERLFKERVPDAAESPAPATAIMRRDERRAFLKALISALDIDDRDGVRNDEITGKLHNKYILSDTLKSERTFILAPFVPTPPRNAESVESPVPRVWKPGGPAMSVVAPVGRASEHRRLQGVCGPVRPG